MSFEIADHTGDVALRLRAPNLEALVVSGIEGLRSLIFAGDPEEGAALLQREVQVSGVDREDCLVQSLSEALHVMQSGALFPTSIQVEARGDELRIALRGPAVDGAGLRQEEEIKAVTYHDVRIREVDGSLETLVILDV